MDFFGVKTLPVFLRFGVLSYWDFLADGEDKLTWFPEVIQKKMSLAPPNTNLLVPKHP